MSKIVKASVSWSLVSLILAAAAGCAASPEPREVTGEPTETTAQSLGETQGECWQRCSDERVACNQRHGETIGCAIAERNCRNGCPNGFAIEEGPSL
ncbi:MAG: hypothetical protein JST00_24135 [Deltaproteobacteria bacterium]|nr:hypothetical protein [Deltaproteobacteria bacterium]